jgi:hypothetical protein
VDGTLEAYVIWRSATNCLSSKSFNLMIFFWCSFFVLRTTQMEKPSAEGSYTILLFKRQNPDPTAYGTSPTLREGFA